MPSEVFSAAMRGSRPLSGAMKALSKPPFLAPEKKGEMYPMRWPPYDNVSFTNYLYLIPLEYRYMYLQLLLKLYENICMSTIIF